MDEALERVSLTRLQREAEAVFERLRSRDAAMVVTRRGRAVAVLLSPEAYDRVERDRSILRLLALGEMEAAAGVGEDLDVVLADAESLLEEN